MKSVGPISLAHLLNPASYWANIAISPAARGLLPPIKYVTGAWRRVSHVRHVSHLSQASHVKPCETLSTFATCVANVGLHKLCPWRFILHESPGSSRV